MNIFIKTTKSGKNRLPTYSFSKMPFSILFFTRMFLQTLSLQLSTPNPAWIYAYLSHLYLDSLFPYFIPSGFSFQNLWNLALHWNLLFHVNVSLNTFLSGIADSILDRPHFPLYQKGQMYSKNANVIHPFLSYIQQD